MRKRIIALVMVLMMVMGMTSVSYAGVSCLDVRDYGHHTYSHMKQTYYSHCVVMGSDGHGNFVVRDYNYDVCICVCGDSYTTDPYYVGTRYVPMW